VQHALAHLKPEGRAALLMPPSAASRRAGRRIRGELLRRGAIRAIVALPPGAAAPHAIGLHLWILQRTRVAAGTVLLVDASPDTLDDAYRNIVKAVETGGAPGHVVPVIDLLNEEVDLTPGRYGSDAAPGADPAVALRENRERLAVVVDALPDLIPEFDTEPGRPLPTVSVGELIRAGQLQLLGPVKTGTEPADAPVLVGEDVVNARSAGNRPDLTPTPRIELQPDDVVIPVLASHLHVRVITEGGPLLGRGLYLLRCDPHLLDPWFVAGHLRTSANERQASSSSSSGTLRFDPRRVHVPRIPVDEQRRHGAVFRRLQRFDDAVREATALSSVLFRYTADSLASGLVHPGQADTSP
jgi:hypothetical protein